MKTDLIYIAQPCGGDIDNIEAAERLFAQLTYEFRDKCFISPILAFSSLYDELSYEEGMELCYSLLNRCDEMWYFGLSKGVRLEVAYANEHGIPVFKGSEILAKSTNYQ